MSTPARQRVGIKEVARAAGVSVTTVSHALNGKGRINAETRERIQRVAAELDYRPNSTARNLVGGRTGLLGLTLSQPPDLPIALADFAYFTQLMMGATTTAMDRGYALVLTPAQHELGADVAIDGAIVVDPVPGEQMLLKLRAAGVPVVTTGRAIDTEGFDYWVDNDHKGSARSVFEHLTRRGAERIALLTSSIRISYTLDTEAAYAAWCEEHGMTPLVTYAENDLTESAGFAAAAKLLADPEPPDAIYATYGRLASGALMAADARGIHVPDDLMIVMTATDTATVHNSHLALTAVNLHPEKLGQRAAELLVALVEGETPEASRRVISTRITARASTRRPKV